MNGNIENLEHGTMTKIARGDVTVMVYDTRNPIQDAVVLVERDGKAVAIELPSFKANIAELTGYLENAGIEVVAKLVSYHAAGKSFLPDVPSYLTASAARYNTEGEGAGLVGKFAGAFGDDFDAGIQNSGETLEGGKVSFAGIDLVVVPNGDAYEVEIPQANAVYMHMLGHDCHSIVAGPAHADAIAANLRRYLDRGFDLFLSAHYAAEDAADVETKISYLGMLKEVAARSEDAAGFEAGVKARCPGYSGDNYLEMTAGLFFPQRRGAGRGNPPHISMHDMPLGMKQLPPCPVETTLTLIGDKWKVLILRDLISNGTMRFGELMRSVGGISQKVLTEKLRSMEEHGLISREVFPEVPPRVEYSLTELGAGLRPVLDSLWVWGAEYKRSNGDDVSGLPPHIPEPPRRGPGRR